MADANSSGDDRSIVDELDYVPECFRIGFERISAVGDRFWVPDVSVSKKPVEGMVFDSIEAAWIFYKEYATIGGFEPIRSTQNPVSGRAVKDGGMVKLKILKCAKAGPKGSKRVVDSANVTDNGKQTDSCCSDGNMPADNCQTNVKKPKKRNCSSKKTGCRAEIRLSLIEGHKYVLYQFREEHNHLLVHPDFIRHLNISRKVNFSKKRLLYKMSEASVGSYAGHRILTKVCGSDDVGFTKSDAKNFKRDVLNYIGDYDSQMVVELLTKKKQSLSGFSFDYFLESDKTLGGFFWADDISKKNFDAFGDVVSFDATYRTNKYDMVFIPFTGVDNHKKCVTFGAGMLSKENVSSYKWLLESFVKAFPAQPRLILTDQDPAMKIAIDSVFSFTRHRLCMWHIMEKVTSKVSASVCNDGFKAKLSRIVWTDKLEPDVFDFLWNSTIEEFKVQDNAWLSDMFDLRYFWIPAYFRNWEMSGLMRTSSRSESENHMFNQLMKSSSTLVEFLTHFDTAMHEKRFNQSKNDHESLYTSPILKHDWIIEEEASKIFSRAVFAEISVEIGYALKKCMSLSCDDSDGVKRFTIVDTSVVSVAIDESIDRVKHPKYFDEFFPIHSEVIYNVDAGEIRSSCKRYERFGMFCRHIFYVMRICKTSHFPKRYVCKRWTKCVVPRNVFSIRQHSRCVDNGDLGLSEIMQRIYYNVELGLDRVIGNKEKLTRFLKAQEELARSCEADFEVSDQMGNEEFISEMLGVEQPQNLEIGNPTGIRNKGSGRRKRITSSRERALKKLSKKGRKCGYCSSYDPHNKRTCPKKIEDENRKKKAGLHTDVGCSQSSVLP